MHIREIEWDGRISLPSDLLPLGYRPGTVVQIITTCTGTLILRIDDSPAIDLPFRRLDGKPERAALRGARRAG